MKFFIDTANVEEIREAATLGVLDGVTTNPSLIAKEGRDFFSVLREIVSIVDGPISAEVTATDRDGMVEEGRELAKLHPNIVIKVPLIKEGLQACKILRADGIGVNVTLCFSPSQALLAAKVDATFISPFIGRLDDISQDGMELIREIAAIFDQDPDIDTQILAASIRHPRHVIESALAGAHIATCPFKVLKQGMTHPLTDRGIERFLADWRAREARVTPVAAGD